MLISTFDVYRQQQPFFAGAQSKFSDCLFAGLEKLSGRAITQNKALEFSKAIVNYFTDFTGVLQLVSTWTFAFNGHSQRQWRDRIGISSQTIHSRREVCDVPLQNEIPSVGGRHLLQPPFKNSESILLGRKYSVFRAHGYFHLECTHHVSPVVNAPVDLPSQLNGCLRWEGNVWFVLTC